MHCFSSFLLKNKFSIIDKSNIVQFMQASLYIIFYINQFYHLLLISILFTILFLHQCAFHSSRSSIANNNYLFYSCTLNDACIDDAFYLVLHYFVEHSLLHFQLQQILGDRVVYKYEHKIHLLILFLIIVLYRIQELITHKFNMLKKTCYWPASCSCFACMIYCYLIHNVNTKLCFIEKINGLWKLF